MTRLDANNEPSMEDILASIRKIIAEDPPGSRPAPAPVAPRSSEQSASAFSRSPLPDPFFQPQPVVEPSAVAPEPYLRASPLKSDGFGFKAAPFFPKASEAKPDVARIEPGFAPSADPLSALQSSPNLAPAALSVDAQLSELLGDSMQQEPAPVLAPAASVVNADILKPSVDFIAKLMASQNQDAGGKAEPAAEISEPLDNASRAGFTVSRDGFVPAKTDHAADSDPFDFDFDLGPSPFLAKPVGPREAAGESVPLIAPVAAPDVEPASEPTEDPDAQPRAVMFAAPSIAATLPPIQSEIAASHNDHQASEAEVSSGVVADAAFSTRAAAAPAAEAGPLSDDPLEAILPVTAYSLPITSPIAVNGPFARAMPDTDITQHSLEETVADLLRPMLRSWLTENMPKIVERALRRELSEQFHSEHQTAAE